MENETIYSEDFINWLAENFTRISEYYYNRNTDDETFSIKEIEMQYFSIFRANYEKTQTIVLFMKEKDSKVEQVIFEGIPSYDTIESYFREKLGGVHSWFLYPSFIF